jgi:hypothetical protein
MIWKGTKKRGSKSKKKVFKVGLPKHLEHINKMASGIDIGSRSHWSFFVSVSGYECISLCQDIQE